MRLDHSEYGEINKYNILIGDVSTIDVDINRATFHQSVDVAGQIDVSSINASTSSLSSTQSSRIDVSDKVVITVASPILILKDTNQRSG
jgi:hypothetical protein